MILSNLLPISTHLLWTRTGLDSEVFHGRLLFFEIVNRSSPSHSGSCRGFHTRHPLMIESVVSLVPSTAT